jgi:hypothetical protein
MPPAFLTGSGTYGIMATRMSLEPIFPDLRVLRVGIEGFLFSKRLILLLDIVCLCLIDEIPANAVVVFDVSSSCFFIDF